MNANVAPEPFTLLQLIVSFHLDTSMPLSMEPPHDWTSDSRVAESSKLRSGSPQAMIDAERARHAADAKKVVVECMGVSCSARGRAALLGGCAELRCATLRPHAS